jgi:hypothetical protein
MSRSGWIRRIGLVVLLCSAAASISWIAPLRPTPLDQRTASVFLVTSAADSGPGSLREAIFSAARAAGTARIDLVVAHIDLESPLPPVSQVAGIVIGTDVHTVIDAQALSPGAVLDIEAPRALIRNITIAHASGTAFLVHAREVQLDGISALDSDIGLSLVGDTPYVDLHDCTLSHNRIGIQLASRVAGIIHNCKFSHHAESAVWAVQTAGGTTSLRRLQIIDDVFTADRDAVVLANLPVIVERSQFVGSLRNAITVLGSAVTFRSNSIRDAGENSILLELADHVVIVDNEIGSSAGTGIMVKSCSAISIEHNRIYGNAYGIVQVLGVQGAPLMLANNLIFSQRLDGLLIIGASPVVSNNRSINNGGSGIKVLNMVHEGRVSVESAPLLSRNETAGNAQDGVVHGTYAL